MSGTNSYFIRPAEGLKLATILTLEPDQSTERQMKNTFRKAWSQTFLGRLFVNDPLMAKFCGLVIIFYLIVHSIKLEVFPFYLFAMYSQPMAKQSEYVVYDLNVDDEPLNFSTMDYRHYTYLMNTIERYSDIKRHEMTLSEAQIIPKVLKKLPFDNGQMTEYLMRNYSYDANQLDIEFQQWIERIISEKQSKVTFFAKKYKFEEGMPVEILNIERR